jgi:hypothetical protein
VLAHHSFAAEYDAKQPVVLKGKITKLEWTNPHAHFYLDVVGSDGKVANWNLELASPNMMVRNGWKRSYLQEGAEVTVNASRAKDGTNTAATSTITLANGRKLGFINANVDEKGK